MRGLALCDISRTAFYVTVEELCDSVVGKGRIESEMLWQRIEEKDLIVLDELGCRSNVGDLEYSRGQAASRHPRNPAQPLRGGDLQRRARGPGAISTIGESIPA